MAKRGRTRHTKRIAVAKAVPLKTKKQNVWLIHSDPGPHPEKFSMPLTVFIRDIVGIATSQREVRAILNARSVKVDGKVRTEPKFPIGLMDVVQFDVAEKYYRINVDHKGRLAVQEIPKAEIGKKLAKIVKKHTVKKGKVNITFHDGRNMISDNKVKIGDSVVLSLPEAKFTSLLKLEVGSKCLIMEGKHAGTIATLKEIIERKGGKDNEAKLDSKSGEFITVAKYLFVVDDSFRGVE